jgi:threonine dehydrogenase-like Zn-dependent dehydrogenase
MGYTLALAAPKAITFIEYDDPPLAAREVRLKTLYSGISAGTEMASYRGTSPHLHKRWDAARRLFVAGETPPAYPLTNWGYEEVGEVIEVGADVTRVAPGARVWGTWGHKSTHVASEEWAAERVLDPGLDPRCGIFSHVGAIALNVILDAELHPGEFAAVFGQGPMGLVVTQLARLNGATVCAVDGLPRRLELARELGAEVAIDFQKEDAAAAIKGLTGQRGADVSIEMTGSYAALQTAIRATAYNAAVIAAGFYQGEGRELYLGEEFHHNRIRLVASQISGSSPRLGGRWDRLRLYQTFMALQAQGRVALLPLISHVLPARRAAEAFQLLDAGAPDAVQVVLEF